MQISDTTPRHDYKFMGYALAIPAPFTEGQVLDAPLTKFINRQLASVIGNLTGQAIRREVEKRQKGTPASGDKPAVPAQPNFKAEDLGADWVNAQLAEILAGYEPGVTNARTGGGSAHDPVQSIADGIAWEKIKERLKALGKAINSVKADKRKELVAQYHAKFPNLLEEARAIYAASTQGADSASGDDDFLGLADLEDAKAPTSGADTQPADASPDSPPSSTVETGGADASDLGTSPSNPGTIGTTDEGTGQGTPVDGDTSEADANADADAGNEPVDSGDPATDAKGPFA